MPLPSSSEGLATFEAMLRGACFLLRPPETLTLDQWADKYAYLSAEGSARPGKFFVSQAEYQRGPMQALSDPAFQTVVFVAASQTGKTQILLIWIGYIAEHDPAPLLFIEPTEDLAKVIVKDRIDPMIRDTPVLKPLFASGRGNDTFHKSFPGGQLSMGWANSPTQLASRPIRYLATDEEGRYGTNAEGDPVDQARKRMATFGSSRKHFRASSPNLRRTCRITKAYEHSDKRRYYVPCPQCGHMQVLRWEQLGGTPDDCFYACEANGCVITEDDKHEMVRRGEWRAENPGGGDGKTAGFQLSAMYSTIGYTWAEMLADYRKCEGIPDKLQVFTNTFLAEPWDEQAEGADMGEIQRRAEVYPAQAPAWVVIVTCGADVQKNRIEATKWGWGLNEQSGVIEHRIFYGDPEREPEVWQAFEAWRAQSVLHQTGLTLPTACTFVDSGDGNRTEAVYRYTRAHRRQHVYASKGSSQPGAPLVGRAKPVGREHTLLVMVGTSTAKDTLYARLQIADRDRPGYIHTPRHAGSGCDSDFYKHLTAEVLVTRQHGGREVAVWENPNKRNEALDCAVYAYAAREFTRANLRALSAGLLQAAAKLSPEDVKAKLAAWAEQAAASAPPSRLSPSSASSPASPLPAPKPAKKGRKLLKRPGFGWIHR